MRNHSSSVKIAKKNAPYGAPQRAVCGFEAVFRLTHTVNQAVIHHDQYSTAGEHGTRELKVSEEVFGSNFLNGRESSITTEQPAKLRLDGYGTILLDAHGVFLTDYQNLRKAPGFNYGECQLLDKVEILFKLVS